MPKMLELVRKARFFAINSHPFERFHFQGPESPNRIIYIGGMEVEKSGKIVHAAPKDLHLGKDEWVKEVLFE